MISSIIVTVVKQAREMSSEIQRLLPLLLLLLPLLPLLLIINTIKHIDVCNNDVDNTHNIINTHNNNTHTSHIVPIISLYLFMVKQAREMSVFGDHPFKLERYREYQHGPCARVTRTHREV